MQGLEGPLAVGVPADAIQVHVLELEQHVERTVLRVGQLYALADGGQRCLAHGDGVVVVQHLLAHFAQEFTQLGAVAAQGETRLQKAFAYHRRLRQAAIGIPRLGDHVDNVHAETVHPAVQPEAHEGIHLLAQRRVLPVQVRLFFAEHVHVVLAGGLVPFPHGTGERGFPVGGG